MLNISAEILSSLFEAVLIYYWIQAFTDKERQNRLQSIMETAGITLGILCIHIFLKNPVLHMSCIAVSCLLLSKRRRISLKTSFLAAITFCILTLPFGSIFILYQIFANDWLAIANILIYAAVISALFVNNIYSLTFLEKKERLEEQQIQIQFLKQQIKTERQYYQSMKTSEKEIRSMRHDLKNVLAALSGYLDADDIFSIRKFLNSQNIWLKKLPFSTGHPAVDAIIYFKREAAQRQNISFDMQIALPEMLNIDEMDLCIILGNALDNALEACETVKPEKRSIILRIRQSGAMLLIEVRNTTDNIYQDFSKELSTTKKDFVNHGFGIKTIWQLAEKNGGTISYEINDGWFCLFINLNLEDPANSVR